MGAEYLLEMKGISKGFQGVQALKGAQLCVRHGEVHALMGENGAGKSTLMKCLFGIYQMDEGEIYLDGKLVHFANPRQALSEGVAMVQQELEQVPNLSVEDNIWLGRYQRKGLFIDDARKHNDTVKIIRDLDMQVDPRRKIKDLSVSEKQMVDIVKAVSYNARVIVLDEPTSSLTETETEKLFTIIRRLKADGCGVIYISHKVDEVMEIADQVTILRDGEWITTQSTREITPHELMRLMVNREMNSRFPPKTNTVGDVVMRVEGLTSVYPPQIENVSFELHAGEILGVGGLVGAGRTELLETIFGLRKRKSGSVTLADGKQQVTGIHRNDGMVFLTEERRVTGIFPLLDIRWNTVASSLKMNRNKLGFISMKKVREHTQWSINAMKTKTPSMKTLISNLSGGNQQKVLFGRCLLTEPDIMLLDEPTRGIDVGAKYEIYQLMIDLASQGKSIIFVSSEMPELIGISDRILVMSNGRASGIIDSGEATQEMILHMATKYL